MAGEEGLGDSWCQVCGDTGGATKMVLCENTDLGCLAGVHLYCLVPLRAEAPTEAWYCDSCGTARSEAAARSHAEAKAREAKRAAAAAARQRAKRQKLEEAKQLRKQQQREQRQHRQESQQEQGQQESQQRHEEQQGGEEQQDQQQEEHVAPMAYAAHTGETAKAATGAKEMAVAAEGVAAARGRPAAGNRAATGSAAAARPQPPAPQLLLQQQPAPRPQAQPPRAVASRDTLSLLFDSLEREDSEQQKQIGRMVDGTSSRMRALSEQQRLLRVQHTLAVCRKMGMLWSGRLQLPNAHQADSFEAALLCYGTPGNPLSRQAAQNLALLAAAAATCQQPPARFLSMDELGIRQDQAWQEASLLLALGPSASGLQAQWAALWEILSQQRQAVGILLPSAAAAPASGTGGEVGAGAASLFLVPNMVDPGSKSLFGLIAVPVRRVGHLPSAAVSSRPARGILRYGPAAAAGGPAAAAASSSQAVGWADVDDLDAQPSDTASVALELGGGSHYATPRRRAAQVSRPSRLPAICAFPAEEGLPLPLDGLRVAMVGFAKQHQLTLAVLEQLRALGAYTYTNQVVVADVLCLHPSCMVDGLERCINFPLGLAHLLATSDVRVFLDSSFLVLHEMVGLQRALQGAEWRAVRLKPVFRGGLIVVLDGRTLPCMPPTQLAEVLSELQRLASAATEPGYPWHAAAAPADLAALQAAAAACQKPAADNWQLWEQSRLARSLVREEVSSSSNPGDPAPAVKHAVKTARVVHASCRLVFLCSSHADTLKQAELQHTILSGSPTDLLQFLKDR